jgi:phosphodiesterase/alkaline phosphatase D-like protein
VTAPDGAYRKLSAVAKQKKVRLAIHAGDQIYFDVPRWGRHPDIEDYRKTYLDAWEDCEPAAEFLTELPHYMILDDHEVIDGFANDVPLPSGAPNYLQLALGTKVYREFQHIHNPESFGSNPLYYKFDVGAARFFVLDSRTERYRQEPGNQMISSEQFGRLRTWMKSNKDRQLFIVTSTPFVANVRQSEDKWSSTPYRWQREKILEIIWKNDIRRVCFLTGDMHNSHHGTLTLSGTDRSDVVVHELMSSPVNQLQKSRISKYAFGTEVPVDPKLPFRYAAHIDKKEFYTGHSNAMLVSVKASKVDFEVHRTKKSAIKPELTGSFKF